VQQFDIVENLNPQTRSRYPFVVVLQHDRIHGLATLIVAPLTAASAVPELDRLHRKAVVGHQSYRVLVEELAAVRSRTLGQTVGSMESERYSIIAAIDLLFTGI
jgi:mRNA-degrading endonuclease toxin of MazEF toxin-antitoxin module